MITVKQLKDLLSVYQSQPTVFSAAIDAETLESMRDESAYTFSFFTQFTEGEENAILSDESIATIRFYFRDRWEALKKTNLAYTRHPFLPVNQLCLKIAEAIAEPEEAVCQILMPDLVGLNRKCASLKFETEENGHFKVENYIINQDCTQLIPVDEVFQTAAIDSNYVLADFQPSETLALSYRLDSRDFLNLQQVAGESSTNFIRVLKQQHVQRYDDNSLGFAIRKLAVAIRKGSVVDAGSESSANIEVIAEAIKTFYTLWRSLPQDLCLPQEEDSSQETRTLVKELSLKLYGRGNLTLESYFLTIFVRHEDCPLTEEELGQQQVEDIFPCAYQISNCLLEFLNLYPALYRIPVAAKENQVQEELPSLQSLLPRVLESLAHRSQMQDGDDKGLSRQFMDLLRRSSRCSLATAADFVAPRIKTYEDFEDYYNIGASKLFKAVFTRVRPRLATLPLMTEMHKVLPLFSDEQQQVIVDIKFNELIDEYNTPEKYLELMSSFEKSVKKHFRKKYAEKLAASINSSQDFLSLLQKISKSQDSILVKVFECLEAKYSVLFASYESTYIVLSVFPWWYDAPQDKILDFIKPRLYEWVNAENYFSFYKLFSSTCALKLNRIIAEQIKAHSISFEVWKEHYIAWKDHFRIQELLLEQLFSQFKDEIKENDILLFLVREASSSDCRIQLIAMFQFLINTKVLFKQYLTFIPESRYENFLLLVTFDFISSSSELQEIADCFSSDKLRDIIFAKFTPEKLNCTEQEFALLTQNKFELKQLELLAPYFNSEAAIERLETYLKTPMNYSSLLGFNFFIYPREFFISPREEMVRNLIYKLSDKRISSLEKVTALINAKKQIESESSALVQKPKNNTLYKCICDLLLLDENNTSAEDLSNARLALGYR